MSGSSGQIRMHVGVGHEHTVADALDVRGWLVQPWGQGLIREEIRAAMVTRWPPVLWRWIPDLIAVRGRQLALVDPKTSLRSDTPNFAIEQSALIAHQIMANLGLQIVYVFADLSCNEVRHLKIEHRTLDSHRLTTGGSGTPYVLVRKADQRPLDDIFGPIIERRATLNVAYDDVRLAP
jgi:hypothetical protein